MRYSSPSVLRALGEFTALTENNSLIPQGCVVGRILHAVGEGPDTDKLADNVVNVGTVSFRPAIPYRKLSSDTVITHSTITAQLDSHGHIHPLRTVGDNTGSDEEDAIWLPVGLWTVSYNLRNGSLPGHQIIVTEAHTAESPLPLFASMDGAPEAGATYVTLQVPLNGTPGYYLVMGESGIGLSWAQGVPPETIAAAVDDYLTLNPPSAAPDASTTTKGLIEIATTAEAVAGTDTSRAVTPEGVAAAINAAGGSGGYPVQQVTLTGNLAYSLPVGAPTDQVVGVVFTQNATGGHTVTYGGDPVAVDTTAGSQTLVEIWPNGEAVVIGAPVTLAASTISDSTAVGRSVLTAADAAAARTAIGAGTSNLVVGTGATDAKAGNYTPPDATASVNGLVRLAGDLTGTAASPALANTAVTPGSYTLSSITVDAKGRITAASSGAAGSVADASTTAKGVVQLAGDLAGTAAAPTVPGLADKVPTTRTVNGKALSANITLTAADVGASTFSGAYADLSGKPTLGTAAATAATDYATAAQGTKADSALQVASAQPINAQTGTAYTLVASDAGKLVTLTNEAAITLTVPGSVFTAGQRVDCLVAGSGMVTAVGSSCTVNGTPTLVSRAQWSAFTVLFTSATTAVVVGDLAAA